MARPRSSSPLLWLGGAVLVAGVLVMGGYWVYAITTAEDMPRLLMWAIFAVPTGLVLLLVAAVRDRIVHKRQENFIEIGRAHV